jgi:hypothetical protein
LFSYHLPGPVCVLCSRIKPLPGGREFRGCLPMRQREVLRKIDPRCCL